MALNGRRRSGSECPFLALKRTKAGRFSTSAYDPKRTTDPKDNIAADKLRSASEIARLIHHDDRCDKGNHQQQEHEEIDRFFG
jgi:hypothetical protein